MGDMTMLVLWIIRIYQPFLQLSVTSHLHGRKLTDGLLQPLDIAVSVFPENLTGL